MKPTIISSAKGIAASSIAILLSLAPALLTGQPAPLSFAYSYSSFALDDKSTLVDFDIEFAENGVTYKMGDDGVETGGLYTRFIFRDERTGEELGTDWITQLQKPATGAPPRVMLGSRRVALPAGSYRTQVYYADFHNPNRRDSMEFTLKVPSFTGKAMQVSDIKVIADASESQDESSPFYKAGYLMVPNVAAVVGPPDMLLNTYLEIYNANEIPASSFHLEYLLATAEKKVFYRKEVDRQRPTASAIMDYQTFPVDSLPSGTYYLIVKAFDGLKFSARDTVVVYRSFVVHNPVLDSYIAGREKPGGGIEIRDSMPIDPLYSGLREEELDEEFAKTKYVMTEPQQELWNRISGVGPKSRFLTQFWVLRDPTPGTPENETRTEYHKRVEDARNYYKSGMTPKGWDSDRGRILLQYGRPDNVDRHPQDFNRKPYEIWTYSTLNYEFVFVDRTQTGLYRLVHSTAPSEIHHPNWEMDYTQLNKNWQDR